VVLVSNQLVLTARVHYFSISSLGQDGHNGTLVKLSTCRGLHKVPYCNVLGLVYEN